MSAVEMMSPDGFHARLECVVPGQASEGTLARVALLEGDLRPIMSVPVRQGKLTFPVLAQAGSAEIRLAGYQPAIARWLDLSVGETAACETPDWVTSAHIAGSVVDDEDSPVPGAHVIGCAGEAITEIDGTFWFEGRNPPCWIRLVRAHGGWRLRSDSVLVDESGDPKSLLLSWKPLTAEGNGFIVRLEPGALVIVDAPPQTPFDIGDRVVEVDGSAVGSAWEQQLQSMDAVIQLGAPCCFLDVAGQRHCTGGL